MKHLKYLQGFMILMVATYFVFPKDAHAYIDPGTGSYIFQILMAALLGSLYAVKVFWGNIKDLFRNFFSRGK